MFDLSKVIKDYDTIFVDLDNTLFNYTHAQNIALQQTSEKFGFSISEYNDAKLNIKKRDLSSNHHKKELYFKNICETKGLNFYLALDMYTFYDDIFNENLYADRSMLKILKKAKRENKKVIAITNYYVLPQIKKLKTTGFHKYIDHLITSEEFEVEKPNVKLLNRALELSETTDKSKVIMFGDSIVDDMGIFGVKYYPYNCSKLLISISGKSGAGKSTISKVLKNVWDCEIIEGDGYHKYERGHKEWKNLTHYDPKANNLIQLGLDIKNIYHELNNINIPIYNHDNGKFDSINTLDSKSLDVVVIDGLHSLYKEVTGDFVKIKIFIDNAQSDEQKIIRDTKKRNKTEKEVLDSIETRSEDYAKYIEIQKSYSNFVISVDTNKNVEIEIDKELELDLSSISFDTLMKDDKILVLGRYENLAEMMQEIMTSFKNNRYEMKESNV